MDKKMRLGSISELKHDYEWEKVLVRDADQEEELTAGLRKGQWTAEEDSKLSTFVSIYGEGRWNSLACLAGLKRSGKSCRLRWLNYLRPDLRRGNFTLEEQLLILQLQFHFGNRWSKIAQHLPGRTDNEIKNYWRTKVQKLAKQLNYEANSPEFRDALLHNWMPRLIEQIQAGATSESNIAFSQLVPSSEGPNHEYGFGPIDLYTRPNGSDCGCFFDSSWAPTSPNWYTDGPVDLHAHNDTLIDLSKDYICNPESSGAENSTPNIANMELAQQ